MDHKPRGPLITLFAGLVTALVLGVLGSNAASDEIDRRNASANTAAAPAVTSAPAPAPTSPPATAAPGDGAAGGGTAKLRLAYAGRVDGDAASIAIVVRDGGAIAYLCDGKRIESWMLGTASTGKLDLSGADGETLTGTYDKDSAAGTVKAAGKTWKLDIPVAKKPTGLYKSTENIRNAKVVTGWIVLATGEQVGMTNTEGETASAPRLNLSDRTATVNGEEVTAVSIDGTSGAGF